jgi:hypothetical protein
MPHELDRFDNGAASMFSVATTPWHREGTVLTGAPSLAEALRIGGLDFEVELRRLFVRTEPYPDRPDVFPSEPTEQGFATVRTDREEVLGIVSKRYQPLQNRDAFGVLEPPGTMKAIPPKVAPAHHIGHPHHRERLIVHPSEDSRTRKATDVYEDYETDEHVLNDQTGHRSSGHPTGGLPGKTTGRGPGAVGRHASARPVSSLRPATSAHRPRRPGGTDRGLRGGVRGTG